MGTEREQATAALAASAALVGGGLVVALFIVQDDPAPLGLWTALAIAFVVLEFSSVEINDRLFVSSSIMVAFTAAAVFGRSSAVLAVALMAAVSVLHPSDLRLRRWRQPAFNFGQLVISNAVGITVLVPFLPHGEMTAGALGRLSLGALLAALAYNWINFWLVAGYARIAYREQTLLPWSRMLGNHALHAVLGVYGALLGASYLIVGPATLPLMFVTFLVGHFGFASFARMRRAHEDTVAGIVKAIEALDPYTKGHTERVARFARMTAEQLGLSPEDLDTLRWAALIHDVGKLAVPTELIRKEEELSASEQDRYRRRVHMVEALLAEVDFLRAAVAFVSGGDRAVIARIIEAADAFDAMTGTRSHRRARTQEAAFAALREDADRFGAEVVDALESAILATGGRYGLPTVASADEVERLVQDRARRA